MQRRALLATAIAASAAVSRARAQAPAGPPDAVQATMREFAALPATASALLVHENPDAFWQVAHDPYAVLFIGSAVKTFILAECLRAVERGSFAETDQWSVDDAVRSLSSPVFANLSGTTTARSVLEAMIAHSDNTATDIALKHADPDHVRELIAQAGLTHTAIPDSTRRLFSYIAGAPLGEDLGWSGLQRMQGGWKPGAPRPPVNQEQSMLGSAADMVRWYQQALHGDFFAKAETLTEFRRIQAMADAIAQVVPPDVAAYAKGGSIDWEGFHCFCIAGQMAQAGALTTFCFTINWTGPDDGIPAMFNAYRNAVASVLKQVVDTRRR